MIHNTPTSNLQPVDHNRWKLLSEVLQSSVISNLNKTEHLTKKTDVPKFSETTVGYLLNEWLHPSVILNKYLRNEIHARCLLMKGLKDP